jgi:ABC-type transporter Mla subunit MlaD
MALQDLTPQLRTRLSRVEWFVGLFLGVTALLMLVGFASYLRQTAEARGWFVTEVPYYTYLPEASGLKVGSRVQLMGFQVGEVTEVNALPPDQWRSWEYYVTNDYNVFVAFNVREKYAGYVNSDARVKVGGFPVDLLGGAQLDLTMGSTNGVITFGPAPNGKPGVLWEKFAYADPGADRTNKLLKYGPLTNGSKGYYVRLDQAETMVAAATRILARVDEISGSVATSLPPLTAELQASVETLRRALPGFTNELGMLLVSARQTLPGLTNNLDQVLSNTRDLTAQLRDTWPMLTNQLEQTLGVTRELAGQLNTALPTLTSNVNVTFTNVNVILTRDTNITANSSQMVSNVNQLLTRHWLFRSAFKDKKPKP